MGLIKARKRWERLHWVLINNLLSAALNSSGCTVLCSWGSRWEKRGVSKRASARHGAVPAAGLCLTLEALRAVLSALWREGVKGGKDPLLAAGHRPHSPSTVGGQLPLLRAHITLSTAAARAGSPTSKRDSPGPPPRVTGTAAANLSNGKH